MENTPGLVGNMSGRQNPENTFYSAELQTKMKKRSQLNHLGTSVDLVITQFNLLKFLLNQRARQLVLDSIVQTIY